MISVIEDNRPRYKVTCPRCKSILQYMDEDVKKQPTGKSRSAFDIVQNRYSHEEEYIDYMMCPLCDCVIIIQKVWRGL